MRLLLAFLFALLAAGCATTVGDTSDDGTGRPCVIMIHCAGGDGGGQPESL
jgi:hypothetical protein